MLPILSELSRFLYSPRTGRVLKDRVHRLTSYILLRMNGEQSVDAMQHFPVSIPNTEVSRFCDSTARMRSEG